MTYPQRHFEFYPDEIPLTDSVARSYERLRNNDIFDIMTAAYGGEILERYYAPPTEQGPWLRQVLYGEPGFSHAHQNADVDLEFDRIIMSSGNLTFVWQFAWQWIDAPTSKVHLAGSYWYIRPYPRLGGYSYIGAMLPQYTANALAGINWDGAAIDPHPPP